MPEYPEVNHQVRYLSARCAGWTIESFGYRWPRHFKKLPTEGREAALAAFFEGNQIERITQRGKYVLLHTTRGLLVSHLMLRGRWSVSTEPYVSNYHHHQAPPEERTTTLWVQKLGDKARLELHDPENWASVNIHPGVTDPRQIATLTKLGPEVVQVPETDPAFDAEWTPEAFAKRAARSGKPIKVFLLDQKRQSGLGNRYVAEALYAARVSPHIPARDLTDDQRDRILKASRATLLEAIETNLDYDNIIKVYKREHDPEGRPVISDEIAGRDSWWVPSFQS